MKKFLFALVAAALVSAGFAQNSNQAQAPVNLVVPEVDVISVRPVDSNLVVLRLDVPEAGETFDPVGGSCLFHLNLTTNGENRSVTTHLMNLVPTGTNLVVGSHASDANKQVDTLYTRGGSVNGTPYTGGTFTNRGPINMVDNTPGQKRAQRIQDISNIALKNVCIELVFDATLEANPGTQSNMIYFTLVDAADWGSL